MTIDKEIRNGVIKSLPEATEIRNEKLRGQVYDAWAMSLATSGFSSIEDIPPSANPDTQPMTAATQADHLRSVTRLSMAIAREMKEYFTGFYVDMDEVIAGGLCHDLGKPFEFDLKNQKKWRADPYITGWPSIRHTVYGVHIALSAGLPEKIAHIAGAHSMEGEHVKRSLVATIIHYADYAFWEILQRGHILKV